MTIYTKELLEALVHWNQSSRHRSLAVAMLERKHMSGRRLQRLQFKLRNRHRRRGWALEELAYMADYQFKAMFRFDRETFEEIVSKVKLDVKKSEVKAISSSGSEISTITKVACTLRFLAGGSYHDIIFAFGISKTSFYADDGVIWPTIYSIDKNYEIKFSTNRIELQ